MTHVKKTFIPLAVTLSVILLVMVSFSGCFTSNETGTVSLSLTDSPIVDAEDVEGVYITIDSIAYNLNNEWVPAENFDGPQTFNLLELTNGNVAPLANTQLSAGTVTQIRFLLDVAERSSGVTSDSSCYIAIDPDGIADGNPADDIIEPIFIPSGSSTGYKANGPFDVPTNGTVEITADFDVRKSVVYAGNRRMENGFYLLKPTIKLIVNNQAGSVSGDFTPDTTDSLNSYVVFAYEPGTYTSSEKTVEDDSTAPFPNAVASTEANDTNDDELPDHYMIAFLAEGSYDLIVTGVDDEGIYSVLDTTNYLNVSVQSEQNTTRDISLSE
ncbi:MAG: DUF4382 domain-containing protein [Fidelibacterota bacterium]